MIFNNDEHTDITYTYYSHDASGNVMATYNRSQRYLTALSVTEDYTLNDHHIYGSSRLGVVNRGLELAHREYTLKNAILADTGPKSGLYEPNVILIVDESHTTRYEHSFSERKVGHRSYELSDWRGNVNVVFTDKKVPYLLGVNLVYSADVVQFTDYSSFGAELVQRTGNEGGDRHAYGFQNQLLDDEIKGNGNSVNYKYRMHDPRIGRFFARDPLSASYPHNSPYAFSENDVIRAIELEGLEKWIVTNYRNNKGVIVKTHYKLANESTKHAEMTLGVGIVYYQRTQGVNSSGEPQTTRSGAAAYSTEIEIHRDYDHSSFSELPENNLHRKAMWDTKLTFLDGYHRARKENVETAILGGDLFLKSDLSKKINQHTVPWIGDVVNVNFAHDKSEILTNTDLNNFNEEMKNYAQLIIDNPGLILEIEGHTSTLGSEDYNMKLSKKRADFIRSKILENLPDGGTSEQKSRIKTFGKGESNPIHKDDKTEQQQNENRRIIIYIDNNGTY
jgi:RHS repeat-associated protein